MTRLTRRLAPALIALAATWAPASVARASPGPLFATAAVPAVPAGGAVGAGESASFNTVSCSSPGNCVAGGSYRNSAGGREAMTEAETSGTWGAPRTVALPANAVTVAKSESSTINSISCPAQGFCVAVGFYKGTGNGTLVAAEVDGVWQTGTTLAAVTSEVTGGGVLDSVSCTDFQDCVSVGTSTTGAGLKEPTIATETDGVWAKPILPTLPSGDGETSPTTLSVSCPGAGDCVVAGTDYPASGPELPMLIFQSGGRWQVGEALGPLSGAVADPGQVISLGDIACSAVGQCTAVGDDQTATGAAGFALVDDGGSFTEVGLPYPAGATGFLAQDTDIGLDAVDCVDAGDCATGGAYPTAGSPAAANAAAMTAVEAGGVWSAPLGLAAPGDAAPVASGLATVTGVSCAAINQCTGVGSYVNTSGAVVPMVAGSVAPLTISSPVPPPPQVGRPYAVQLASSGGAGAASWTVSSGTLPIGLTLNSATGVISGTPDFVQTSAFTVSVTDSGPPAQTASAAYSVTVSRTAPPAPELSHLRVTPSRVSAAGRRTGRRCEAITRRNRAHSPCLRAVTLSLRSELSVAASVRLTATLELPGREVRHGLVLRCRALTHRDRRDRRCTRTAAVRGHVTLSLPAGSDRVRWVASLDGRSLAPGTYRLRLVPTAAGETGAAVTATVTITS